MEKKQSNSSEDAKIVLLFMLVVTLLICRGRAVVVECMWLLSDANLKKVL